MSPPLPTKLYLVDRTPPATCLYYTGRLRRIYAGWAQVKLFVNARYRSGRQEPSTFKIYEADVTWREVQP